MRYGGVGSQAEILDAVMLSGIEQSEQERAQTIPWKAWLRDIEPQEAICFKGGSGSPAQWTTIAGMAGQNLQHRRATITGNECQHHWNAHSSHLLEENQTLFFRQRLAAGANKCRRMRTGVGGRE